jgi:hypothetical protein
MKAKRLLGWGVALVLVAACGKAASTVVDGVDAGADAGPGGGKEAGGGGDGGNPFDGFVPDPFADANIDVQAPAESCDPDDAGVVCPAPRSVCGSQVHLVSFTNGRCEDGGCVWDQLVTRCSGFCNDGGCEVVIVK